MLTTLKLNNLKRSNRNSNYFMKFRSISFHFKGFYYIVNIAFQSIVFMYSDIFFILSEAYSVHIANRLVGFIKTGILSI